MSYANDSLASRALVAITVQTTARGARDQAVDNEGEQPVEDVSIRGDNVGLY